MPRHNALFLRLLFFLSVLCSLAVGRMMSLALAREDEDPQWIVDTVDTKCSKPCGGGVRRVTYKCAVYKHSSGETFSQPAARCAGIAKPPRFKSCNQEKCYFGTDRMQNTDSLDTPYEWRNTKNYTKCINGCFGGTRCIINRCWNVRRSSWVSDKKCASIDEPQKVCQTCTEFVSCPPSWRKGEWSVCSRTCGSGIRTREVSCSAQLGAHHFTNVDATKCIADKKPHSSERCARKDCPPEFVTSKWGPCKNANPVNCGIGERRRKVSCIRALRSGIVKKIGYRPCVRRYGIKGFPPTWQVCTNYNVKLSASCKKSQKSVLPKIIADNTTVVQMRRVRRIRLQVGEVAYVFPRTALVIKCPVKDYDPRDLVWTKDGDMVNTATKRIQMNYRGRLKIRSTRRRDAGKWSCIAGPANASIILHLRYPSEGFREFAIRQPLLAEQNRNIPGMMSDAAANSYLGQSGKMVQWVAGSWSACSRTCGGPGVIRRRVQCERVKANYYKVFDPKKCERLGLTRPPSEKKCGGFNVCPMWQVEPNKGKCTNQCLRPGFALLKDRVFCGMNTQRLPLKFCDQSTKPVGVADCVNPSCQLAWKSSPWSECSRTCGGRGVMARHMTCIWRNSGANAGFGCFKFGVKQPQAFKFCETPKCVLDCIDLTAQCATIKPSLCRFAPYQRFCCQRCKSFGMQERKKVRG